MALHLFPFFYIDTFLFIFVLGYGSVCAPGGGGGYVCLCVWYVCVCWCMCVRVCVCRLVYVCACGVRVYVGICVFRTNARTLERTRILLVKSLRAFNKIMQNHEIQFIFTLIDFLPQGSWLSRRLKMSCYL